MNTEYGTATANFQPRLYSAGSIMLLSMLFSTIAGGVMTAQNLRDIRQRGPARVALWGSIGYTIIQIFLTAQLPSSPGTPWLAWPIGLAGGMALRTYFAKYYPNWITAPLKRNFKPFLTCLLVIGIIMGLAVYPSLNR